MSLGYSANQLRRPARAETEMLCPITSQLIFASIEALAAPLPIGLLRAWRATSA